MECGRAAENQDPAGLRRDFILNAHLGDSDPVRFSLGQCVDNSFLTLLSQEGYNMPPEQLSVCERSVVSDSLATPWTVAHQAPLSMGFPGQEYWSVFPTLGDVLDPVIESVSPALFYCYTTMWKLCREEGVWSSASEF